MAAPAQLLLPALSKPAADPSAADLDLSAFSTQGTGAEAPLTSEPPLPDAEPLTSEPPLAEASPLTSESAPDFSDPLGAEPLPADADPSGAHPSPAKR
ncbi:hypothetical protein [Streptomyces tropicalis]|uniref:Secreted protein n=1 Tax=Streptomyces tropicalis TaxID=3034234 RepID=A0ABT5ZYT9_9ACTN|nr:hypothetical protein [Streptomyces tropicalis]MDF3297559.1 hypothetical protein [Streptomyces tropicalis]